MDSRTVNKIFGSALFVWFVLFIVLAGVVYPFSYLGFLANPIQWMLIQSGQIAIWLLLINLYIPFLLLVTPKKWGFARLKQHRRTLGLMSAVFVGMHATTYVSDKSVSIIIENFTKPFILLGFIAFLGYCVLTVTSNRKSVQYFGKKAWKWIHRSVYLLIPLLMYHTYFKDKGNPVAVAIWFAPLLMTYGARIFFFVKNSNSQKN